MAHFLRDELLKNLTIDEEALTQISRIFEARAATMPEVVHQADGKDPDAFLTYIIRFDNKGYRVFALQSLVNHFTQASYVERILFTLESGASLRSGRSVGSLMELRLDEKDASASFLSVTADDGDWVDSSFSAVKEILVKCKNQNGWARSAWTHLTIQLVGVFIGFFLSLWAAAGIAPQLSIENAFAISFLLVLLVFSNLWTYINQRLHALVNFAFPNLKFYRPNRDKMHWLLQGVVLAIVGAVTLYVINLMFSYAGHILDSFVRNST